MCAIAGPAVQALKDTPEEEREAAVRKLKLRVMGNIGLIAELYKQDVVSEKILHACIQELLGDGKSQPIEDNVEVMCPLLCHFKKMMALATIAEYKKVGELT